MQSQTHLHTQHNSARQLHTFRNTHTNNDKEKGARNITGMLTTPPQQDAKQNSIKLAHTNELIPTQSGQEIDFFINPPQWLLLPTFPRHIQCLSSQLDLKKIQTAGCLPKRLVEWTNFPATVKIYHHRYLAGGNSPAVKAGSQCISSSPHLNDLQGCKTIRCNTHAGLRTK